ncbi:hypothetical protein JMJ35_010608 [Cladonia borealis]|uniref:DUF7587 domain-containing protein n=1 Tax=Cladonia borealis TaxID=184061 RepID=A0AA39UWY8_9LECA|nr:hypothetical protein JMJ35_010608 [Cladonia borealis]
MAAPLKYYRVQDDSSATHFDEENGFFAGDIQLQLRMFSPRDRAEERNLSNALGRHLNWSNRTPSPFISVYADLDTAVNSAVARVKDGKREVFIAYIDVGVEGIGDVWYRYVPKVAEEVGLRIQRQALGNSKQEFVFLHHIPAGAITKYRAF